MTNLDWIPGAAIATGASALLWWRQLSVTNALVHQRLNSLAEATKQTAAELKETVKVLQTISTDLAASIEKQGTINTVTTQALEAVLKKLDGQQERLSDHGEKIAQQSASLELMREFMSRTRGDSDAYHAQQRFENQQRYDGKEGC